MKFGVAKRSNKTTRIFSEICPNIFDCKELRPSDFVDKIWSLYKDKYPSDNAINGKIFEYIIASVLIRERIRPFCLQARLAFIPGIDFDVILLSEDGQVISLSLKTSFRERYKQADLEAMALKSVHRKAFCCLLTLEDSEAQFVDEKRRNGEVLYIDRVIAAKTDHFNALIKELASKKYLENKEEKWIAYGSVIKMIHL